jgi:hypothetical protein
MDDQQRQPRDGDRNPVRDRIKKAVSAGRISAADGQIRLTNVASAQSMAELGLITRDLDQLEAVIQPGAFAPGPAAPATPPGAWATPTTASSVSTAASAAAGGVRRTLPLLVGVLVLALAGAGVAAYFVFSGSSSSTEEGRPADLPTALPITPSAKPGDQFTEEPGSTDDPVDAESPEPGASFELDAAGIRSFLATYRAKFGTTKVVELNMYDDYVVMQVPVPGKARHSGWLYRDGEFTDFGGVTTNFPGAEVVDTRRLDIPALMKNIAKARRSLNVEDYTTTYVTLNYKPQFDEAPNVNVYVSNEFHESGYLATELDGKVDRAYPFGS